MSERAALFGALLAMPAVERDQVKVHARQIDAGAERAVNIGGPFRGVVYPCAAHDNVKGVENGVYERHAHAGDLVFGVDFKRIGLAAVVEID